MNRKSILDTAILVSCITGIILSCAYLENSMERMISLAALTGVGLLFLILLITDADKERYRAQMASGKEGISEIQLLGEEDTISAIWDIYGKTSIVFGRDEGENQVDINLKNTDYAGTVDVEHAVMNYCNGGWYVEDLDSENGTRLQRGGAGNRYRVSSREPCRVEKGDIIYLGLAPVRVH